MRTIPFTASISATRYGKKATSPPPPNPFARCSISIPTIPPRPLLLARCLKKQGPRASQDPRLDNLERLKTNFEERAYMQLKSLLAPVDVRKWTAHEGADSLGIRARLTASPEPAPEPPPSRPGNLHLHLRRCTRRLCRRRSTADFAGDCSYPASRTGYNRKAHDRSLRRVQRGVRSH